MVHRGVHKIPIVNKVFLIWFLALFFLPSGCGDGNGDGDGGGFGGVGGTIGGVGTTSILYVTNRGPNDVSGYSINTTGGTLTAIPGSPFSNVSGPSAIAVSSNGFFAYVTNSRTNNVTGFRVSTEGALLLVPPTPASPNPVAVDAAPGALAISPDTKHLYVANSGADTVAAFNIETAGSLTLIPQTGGHVNPVSVNGSDPVSIAIPENGKFLYVANSGSQNVTVFQIGTNGLLTLVPPAGPNTNPVSVGGTTPNALMISRNGRFLYSANGGGTVSVFTIRGDGLLTLVPSSSGNPNPVSAGTNPVALTMSQDG